VPFTPFHFPLCATISLPLRRYIDFPIFLFSNVIIDLEVLAVMIFGSNQRLHGYAHTFLIGSIVAVLYAVIAFKARLPIKRFMEFLKLPYETTKKKMISSAILGFWVHIFLDALLYRDIRPFYPSSYNPFYGVVSRGALYLSCTIMVIPAIAFYLANRMSASKKSSPHRQ